MHLQSLNSCNEYNTVGHQGARPTFNVESFLHTTVRAETTFSDHISSMCATGFISFSTSQFKCNLICDSRRVPMSYVRKRAGVDENRSSLTISDVRSMLTSSVCIRFGLQSDLVLMEILDSILHKDC
jgi:hypothetical protein